MRLTLPHYVDFAGALDGDLDSAGAWDTLRQTNGPFGIAHDREGLLRMLNEHPEIADRARAVSALIRGSVASYGAGVGMLEAGLDAPDLTLTDYAPATVDRLRDLFPGCRVLRHDLLADGPLDADLHLFHRIDTEFTNRQWRQIFSAFRDQRIVFVPGGMGTPRELVHEVRLGRERQLARAGWRRTRAAFAALWRRTHRSQAVSLSDMEGWVLAPLHQPSARN